MPTPLDKSIRPKPAGTGRGKYKWDNWLIAGESWTLTEAEDFPGVNMDAFRQLLRKNAISRGLKATTRKVNDTTINVWLERK